MAVVDENQLIEQLMNVGNRLLQPPSSNPELLNLLDEVELLLSKLKQSPSELVQEVLLPPMKAALIADELLRSSDEDIKFTVASCLNEVMRISAPNSPYEDEKMKEIFELIVSAFDKLSSMSGRPYSKAVLILESVAKLRSCVMMLDLGCDPLIVEMFELFLKNISSNHPSSVFVAMEMIMSVMIKETEDDEPLELELLKVLLPSLRKENKNVSPASFELGTKVITECAEKLKPHIMGTLQSMGCCVGDYAPILSLICNDEPGTNAMEEEPTTNEGNSSKRGRKPNPLNTNEGYENSVGKGKTYLGNSSGRLKKTSVALKTEEKAIPAVEEVSPKEEAVGPKEEEVSPKKEEVGPKEEIEEAAVEHKQLHKATPLNDSSKKKGKTSKMDASGGSGKRNTAGSSRKDKAQMDNSSKSHKKRASSDDDVMETPHGRMNYREDLIGRKIKVWWPLDRRYYEGSVTSFQAHARKHKVSYDDGDEEVLNLRKERWEFIGDEGPFNIEDLLDDEQAAQPPPSVLLESEESTESEKETSQAHTRKKRVTTDSGAESRRKSEKSKKAEAVSETKRAKLSHGSKS